MALAVPNPEDRRVQRTRLALRGALIALLQSRSWEEIRVQDVCDKANVGRSTFYNHFPDKEDLLVGGFEDLRRAVRQEARRNPGRTLHFAHGLIEHAGENERLFRALVGQRSGQVVLQRFRDLVVDLVRDDLRLRTSATGAELEVVVHYLGGAFLELLRWWLENQCPLEPTELEHRFQGLSASAVRALPTRRGFCPEAAVGTGG